MIAVWLVGPPGAGKTTLIKQYIDSFDTEFIESPKWTITNNLLLAGHYFGEKFDGADTVPYNAIDKTLHFWQNNLLPDPKYTITIFDGDRFSDRKSLEYVLRFCSGLCVYLNLSRVELDKRRRKRGSKHNTSWVKGRETKSKNFFNMFEKDKRFMLDGEPDPQTISTDLMNRITLHARATVRTEYLPDKHSKE